MCPLRFILVFFSAILAGYFAWRSLGNSPDGEADLDLLVSGDSAQSETPKDDQKKQERNMRKVIQDGFWVFVDMASGRYLWRSFKEMNEIDKVKSC